MTASLPRPRLSVRPVSAALAITLLLAAVAAAGCGTVAADLPPAANQRWDDLATPVPEAAGPAGGVADDRPIPPRDLVPPTLPLPGPELFRPGGTLESIHRRGYLRVGVSRDTQLRGAWNPVTRRFEGFDVDIARRISTALFGRPDPGTADEVTRYLAVSYSERVPAIVQGAVDIVVSTMTYTPSRAAQVGMSAAYFTARPRLLVRVAPTAGADGRTAPTINSFDDLIGKRVCAPRKTTSLNNLRNLREQHGEFEIVGSLNELSDCLVAFQQGSVDAVAANDASLVGMLKQDATATLAGLDIGPAEYYSVAFRRDDAGLAGKDTELAGFVNGVLESIRRDPPAWMALCEEWEVPEMPCDESMPPEPQWAR